MNNAMFYPGNGYRLRAAGSTGVPTEPNTESIPDGGYSETFSPNGMIDFMFDLICVSAAATADILVEKGIDAAFSAVTTHATIPLNTLRTLSWSNNAPESGQFYRIKNTSGRVLQAWLQLRIN